MEFHYPGGAYVERWIPQVLRQMKTDDVIVVDHPREISAIRKLITKFDVNYRNVNIICKKEFTPGTKVKSNVLPGILEIISVEGDDVIVQPSVETSNHLDPKNRRVPLNSLTFY